MSLSHDLKSRKFRFGRADGSFICNIVLDPDGRLKGPSSVNEVYWAVENETLIFQNRRRETTTRFDEVVHAGEPYSFRGHFVPNHRKSWHILTELAGQHYQRECIQDVINAYLGRSGDSFALSKLRDLSAGVDSALYMTSKMSNAIPFGNKMDLLTDAMNRRSVSGLILEFGVFTGTTINHIAAQTDQQVYGFDVFTGLPETWRPGFPRGAFRVETLPKVRSNVELMVGLFGDTLGPFLEAHTGFASLIHVDCDLYSSTKTIFERLAPIIVKGTVIVFDEYFNYPGWREHEFKAFQEYVAASGSTYTYLSFVDNHQQVAVQITS